MKSLRQIKSSCTKNDWKPLKKLSKTINPGRNYSNLAAQLFIINKYIFSSINNSGRLYNLEAFYNTSLIKLIFRASILVVIFRASALVVAFDIFQKIPFSTLDASTYLALTAVQTAREQYSEKDFTFILYSRNRPY